jgi:5-methylcytosine-specific restriction endonuclease McrA
MKSFFAKAWTVLTNPGQEERVGLIVNAIGNGFRTQKQAFELTCVLEPIECTQKDVDLAVLRYFDSFVERYWQKGVPEGQQLKTALWVALKLGIPTEKQTSTFERHAAEAFAVELKKCIADGILEPAETQLLSKISATCSLPLDRFAMKVFRSTGHAILSEVFAEAIQTGGLNKHLWRNFSKSLDTLGVRYSEIEPTVKPLIQSFAEHVLVDAKADGEFTTDEIDYINWLIDTFGLSDEFQCYALSEINRLRLSSKILAGDIPHLPWPHGSNVTTGELLHISAPATMLIPSTSSRPDRIYHGDLMLSDSRLLFQSLEKSVAIKLRSLISYQSSDKSIVCQIANKPTVVFSYRTPQELAGLIVNCVMRLNNQTLVKRLDGAGPSRHIPRDVRQRVWQQYGGKCVECGAMEYLEYDHIIPVAKGGSNDEKNVQLLCRKCNLTKSDRI